MLSPKFRLDLNWLVCTKYKIQIGTNLYCLILKWKVKKRLNNSSNIKPNSEPLGHIHISVWDPSPRNKLTKVKLTL